MSLDDGPGEGVIQELKRRRVIRVMIAYVAACLGVLSAASLGVDFAGGPEWVFRALLGAAALGFPSVAVLAWTFDVTPEGIVRTPDRPSAAPPGDAVPAWVWSAVVSTGLFLAVGSWLLRRAFM